MTMREYRTHGVRVQNAVPTGDKRRQPLIFVHGGSWGMGRRFEPATLQIEPAPVSSRMNGRPDRSRASSR